MAHTAYEMMWIKFLIFELGFDHPSPMLMHYGNRTVIYIASNLIFHERTKHIEVNYHFVRNAMMNKTIRILFTPLSKQLADILTESLSFGVFNSICNKMGIFDTYASV